MILGIKTDQPQAELILDANGTQHKVIWQAHRELSDTIFYKLDELLKKADIEYRDLTGLVVFKGPGSFTGLRIGITVANTLAYSLQQPIIGVAGDDWFVQGQELLEKGVDNKIVIPEYGGEANITKPRK